MHELLHIGLAKIYVSHTAGVRLCIILLRRQLSIIITYKTGVYDLHGINWGKFVIYLVYCKYTHDSLFEGNRCHPRSGIHINIYSEFALKFS